MIVWRLDRLARSLKDLIEIAGQLHSRNIGLISLTENIDTTTPTGKFFFHIFGALAEFERNLIVERTQARLAAAKARGRKGGRKPVLDADKKKAAEKLLESSSDFAAVGRSLGVSERTIRRFASGQYRK